MKGQENAVNTFKDGLLMDTNPLSNDGTSLTNALNATLTTNNGNELMLLNDMGNGRINKVRLDEGYIPVGMKEHGGIIYIASYNPESKKGQIGSFPYPKVEYDNSDFIDDDPGHATELNEIYGNNNFESPSICNSEQITFTEIKHNSLKVRLFIINNEDGEQVQAKFKLGDSFSITFDEDTLNYLKADNVEASIVSKTSSDYVTLYTINKEELPESNFTISLTYNYPYSGTLFLQISLNIPDTFDISYKYDNGNFIIYPYAYKFDGPLINTTMANVSQYNNNVVTHICNNFNCGSPIILENEGTYYLCPITSDKGYLDYLTLKLILDLSESNNIFKYTFNDGLLNLRWDIFSDDPEHLGGDEKSYSFTYNFYPLEAASSVRNLEALKLLTPTQRIIKEGYPTVSGVRNIKCNLISDTIYVLLITVATKVLDTYINEEACFGGFIYGTSRYNDMFDAQDNFNDIEEEDKEVKYTFNKQLLELNRTSITNKHLLYDEDAQEDRWQETQGIIVISDTLIPTNNIPKAYSSEIAVTITKTEDSVVVSPTPDIKLIYDSDLFSIPSSRFNINLSDTIVSDIPEKNKNTRIITSYNPNDYKEVDKTLDFITFYRYISSENSDGLTQQTRTFKLLMPIFDPNMSKDVYNELFGFDFSNNSTTGVFGAKHYLNMTEYITLSVGDVTDTSKIGIDNQLTDPGTVEDATPGIVKQFLLLHSKEERGQDVSSIFDLFGGAVYSDYNSDYASLRLREDVYMPNKVFAGLDEGCASDEFADRSKFLIPSCITYTNKPLLLLLPSSTIGICYTNNYQDTYDNRGSYPMNIITPAQSLNDRTDDLLIPAFKKLFCLLSQIFTLQSLESYIYIVGPSEVTINYNVLDNSYVKYTTELQSNDDIFIDANILENLNSVKGYLNESTLIARPKNYIGKIKLQELLEDNYFFYGRNVILDSTLYNNILSQYINAYDESVVIDNSAGYSINDIYYLDSNKIWELYENLNDYSESINNFNYTDAHDRITLTDYPMDHNHNGDLVTEGDYNKIWSDYDIYYNPKYNCYQYDLSKVNYFSLLTKSVKNSDNYLLDWAGNCWKIPTLINSFMTIEEAKDISGNLISSYSNNFIVLRTLNTISSDWVEGEDSSGPHFARVELGFRGGGGETYNDLHLNNSFLTFLGEVTRKILNIINLYNHDLVAITGGYPS